MVDPYALGTFTQNEEPRWPGAVRNGKVARLTDILPGCPDQLSNLFANWSDWKSELDEAISNSPESSWSDERNFVAHLPFKPENLFGAGANYRQHVIELIVDTGVGGMEAYSKEKRLEAATRLMDERAATGTPFVWVGLRSAIAGPARPLLLPFDITQPDWELELAVVIGKPGRRVNRSEALDYVAGYTIANDVTARELVHRKDAKEMGMDWLACKSLPGFHILGPYITPAKFVPDPQDLQLKLSLNGEVMQDEGTDDMIFNVARLIEYISTHAQLNAGDIIMTGSPSGNGTHFNRFLSDGDQMVGEITGLIGQQTVNCVMEK